MLEYYRPPFPDLKSALSSFLLMFMGFLSVTMPLLNLNSYLEPSHFSTVSMLCTYTAICFTLAVMLSLIGIIITKYVMLFILYCSIISSSAFHLYLFKDLPNFKIYFYFFSVFFNLIGIAIAHSKLHTNLIKYRKKHIEYGRELRKKHLRDKKRSQ